MTFLANASCQAVSFIIIIRAEWSEASDTMSFNMCSEGSNTLLPWFCQAMKTVFKHANSDAFEKQLGISN